MHASGILDAGAVAPNFTLHVTPDQTLTLSDLLGRPVILAFYPADWSPVCGGQMALYNEILPEFRKFGAELLGVSVDGSWFHGAFAEARHLHFSLLAVWPGAALLPVRGKVLENGMPGFFRRFAEGVFDVEDLKFRTEELAQFIEAASKRYDFSMKKLIAVGYSNGANIAASLILLHPHHLAAAVLFRAMVPFGPDIIRDFNNLSVFIGAGA
jgi:peroxiredoxin